MSKNTNETSVLMNLLIKYRNIARESINLADEYSGGESESCKVYNEKYEKLEKQLAKIVTATFAKIEGV